VNLGEQGRNHSNPSCMKPDEFGSALSFGLASDGNPAGEVILVRIPYPQPPPPRLPADLELAPDLLTLYLTAALRANPFRGCGKPFKHVLSRAV
jgi:hypothetical protein